MVSSVVGLLYEAATRIATDSWGNRVEVSAGVGVDAGADADAGHAVEQTGAAA